MVGKKRQSLLPRRRRHDDEGEEDGSMEGEAPEYASTAGSLISDAGEDGASNATDEARASTPSPVQIKQESSFHTTANTSAMLQGSSVKSDEHVEESHIDRAEAPTQKARPDIQRSKSSPIQETGRRYHGLPTNMQRNKHTSRDERGYLPTQMVGRGRGQPFAGGQRRVYQVPAQVQEQNKQWKHDLHETINQPDPAATKTQVFPQIPDVVKSNPSRSFSTTTVLGSVSVNVILPEVETHSSVHMVKKHYTLLPQHRPPLRRDKPVRISIPDEHPRFIFPSTERSFIFIPRAMRPNQQQRARGRGSFGGSRRTSMYSYTPSVGMSRRPSVVTSIPGSGTHTPLCRPIVRIPVPPNLPALQNAEVYLGHNSAIVHSPPTTLPMHQPVPQKAVLLADIESPTQGSQQAFHQQLPEQSRMPHIPESAIYAQPFQPYPVHNMYDPGMALQPAPSSYVNMAGQNIPGESFEQQGPYVHETNGMVYYYDPSQQFYPAMIMPQPYYYPPISNPVQYQ